VANATVSTIGFTKTTAERFFQRLLNAGVRKVVDVRLRNTSQLAGFAKADDLAYFLKKIGGIEYVHQPLLAPIDSLLKTYRNKSGEWRAYEEGFLSLMSERQIENRFEPETFDGACLLCSEASPHHCHRRLVCDYLNEKWGGALEVHHF
jgi:uncharacterized protein (DUF488 family)